MTTTMSAFKKVGIESNEVVNHFAVLKSEYAPTLVIKKSAFTNDEVLRWRTIEEKLPKNYPAVTFLPFSGTNINQSNINNFLSRIIQRPDMLQKYIEEDTYDISPCKDEKPYFYKIHKSVPDEYFWLLSGIICFNALVVWLPLRLLRKKKKQDNYPGLFIPLIIFVCIGVGFMVLEISLFQKFVLYLGSATVSLSILLYALLVGMGVGSICGQLIIGDDLRRRLFVITLFIVAYGSILFITSPYILSKCLVYSSIVRSIISFVLILPFGASLGIPLPTCIQMLKQENLERFIPWVYAINGAMSVLGSVLAIILSMLFGFTPTFFIGLSFYVVISLLLYLMSKKKVLFTG